MRAPAALVVVLGALLSAGAACSLGAYGEERAAPPADASAEGGPTASDDAAPPGDAGQSDAEHDAGPSFCAKNADAGFFCEDFDGPNPLARFDRVTLKGGTVSVDAKAMVAEVSPADATGEAFVVVAATVKATRASLAFAVRPETIDKTTSCQFAKIFFFGAQMYEVGLGIHPSSELYAYEYTAGGAYKELGSMPALSTNADTRFVLEADVVGPPMLVVRRDGAEALTAFLAPTVTEGVTEGALGLPFVPASHGAWKLRFDDVVMSLIE